MVSRFTVIFCWCLILNIRTAADAKAKEKLKEGEYISCYTCAAGADKNALNGAAIPTDANAQPTVALPERTQNCLKVNMKTGRANCKRHKKVKIKGKWKTTIYRPDFAPHDFSYGIWCSKYSFQIGDTWVMFRDCSYAPPDGSRAPSGCTNHYDISRNITNMRLCWCSSHLCNDEPGLRTIKPGKGGKVPEDIYIGKGVSLPQRCITAVMLLSLPVFNFLVFNSIM